MKISVCSIQNGKPVQWRIESERGRHYKVHGLYSSEEAVVAALAALRQ